MSDTTPPHSAEFDPQHVTPFPSAPARKEGKNTERKRKKSAILTDKPVKNAFIQDKLAAMQKKSKLFKKTSRINHSVQSGSKKRPKQKPELSSNDENDFMNICLPGEQWVRCISC